MQQGHHPTLQQHQQPSTMHYGAERAQQAANSGRGVALSNQDHHQQQQQGQGGQGMGQHKQAGFLGGAKPIRRMNDPPPRSGAPPSLTPAQPLPPSSQSSQSSPSSQSAPNAPASYPALHLTPLNGTFVPKQVSLDPPGVRVKIGRQTNAKTIPSSANAYFDSKVLSRAHAEVWSEDGKVFIKDVKSSNGTFINGERLSPESSESDVFELHTDDIVEFGIDILTDDTKTIVHHKVAAKVHLVLNADDAAASSREIQNWYRSAGEQPAGRARPARPAGGGQNGLSFEHVLSRLQGELQKSRDTGANLADVNSSLTAVHDTLGGGAPPPLPPNAGIPGRSGPSAFPPRDNPSHAQSIAALQAQLADTQTSLAGHVGKIRDLEGLLAEHDTIKREVGTLRMQMEEAQVSWQAVMRERERDAELPLPSHGSERENGGRESPIAALFEAQEAEEDAEGDEDGDFDDGASVSSVDTIAPSRNRSNGVAKAPKKNAVTEEDVDHTDAPSSPPPSSTPASEEDAPAADSARETLLAEQNAKLVTRLEALSSELDEATRLGAQLREQHASASLTIRALEERIVGLEKAVDEAGAGVEEKWGSWRKGFEEGWKVEREGWEAEGEGLRRCVREWEEGKERDRKEREEGRARRAEKRAAKRERALAQDEDGEAEDDESGDEEDDDFDEEDEAEDDDESTSATPSPAGSKPSSPSKHSSSGSSTLKPRQRHRSASPTPTPASVAAATLAATSANPKSLSPAAAAAVEALSSSAGGAGGGTASDSDSTIGSRRGTLRPSLAASSGAGSGTSAQGERFRSGGAGHGQKGEGQTSQGLPFSLAGAVVVIAVAVGYGAAMKLKE